MLLAAKGLGRVDESPKTHQNFEHGWAVMFNIGPMY